MTGMRSQTVFHRSFAAMNSRFTMLLPATSPRQGHALATEVSALLHRQHQMMNPHAQHSPIRLVNRMAANGRVLVGKETWELLRDCRWHWERTLGAFDVASRCSINRGTCKSAAIGMEHVHLDARACTVQFASPGVWLDLRRICREVALDKVRALLRKQGIERAFISFGAHSVAVIGGLVDQSPWELEVTDPHTSRPLHTLPIFDGAMCVARTPNRAESVCRTAAQSHQQKRVLAVTGTSSLAATAITTALLRTPQAKRASILRHYPQIRAVEFTYPDPLESDSGRLPGMDWRCET